MFNRAKINTGVLDISSKMTLKLSCLAACDNDIDKADKLYAYMIKDVGDIPDFPAQKPSMVQQVTQSIDSVFGWIDQNSDKFMKGYNLIQTMRGGNVIATGTADIPPLPEP